MERAVPFIVGIDGTIGRALWKSYKAIYPYAFGTSRRLSGYFPKLDLTCPNINDLEVDFSPFTHAIISAAVPSLRQCELDPVFTRCCNVTGTLELAKQLDSKGIQPVLFSSDYVFDGVRGDYSEEDLPCPVNEYGRQKVELEERLSKECSSYLVLRLTKVFSVNDAAGGLLGEVIDKLEHGERIRAAHDQTFNPIWLDDVVAAVSSLMDLGAKGLFHLGGPEIWTRWALSMEIARLLGKEASLIEKISLDDLCEPFKRPKKTNLLSHKFEMATGMKNKTLSQLLAMLFRAKFSPETQACRK